MDKLYVHTEQMHNFRAARAVVPFVIKVVSPNSILDVGCGTGTWLKVFEENGVSDYLGVDGDYVEKNLLKIPLSRFVSHDLTKELSLQKKFDLVVSLEVAEHLPEKSADLFVKTLVDHGLTILFSAAIPGQSGQNHLNEQWPTYWADKFAKHGYYFHDIIRPEIWGDENVDWWYKQNTFLVNKEFSGKTIMNLVHPLCFKHNVDSRQSLIDSIFSGSFGSLQSFKIFLKSVRYKILKS
jgi:cyclopropane fatty-acyl-phospholipid synthase-like methyltransferase